MLNNILERFLNLDSLAKIHILNVFLVVVVILYIILRVYFSKPKCPNCGKRKCKKLKGKKLIKKYQTTIEEKRTDVTTEKDKSGSITKTHSKEYIKDVPATAYVYEVNYVCKKCGEAFSKEETKTKKN